MDVLTFIVLSFCVGHCYGQNTQRKRKMDKLQLKLDDLSDLATELRLDIADLQSWRNATVVRARGTGVIEADRDCVDSQLVGRFEQSLYTVEGQVKYITKGLEREKMALRRIVENISAEVRQQSETKFQELKNKMENAFDAKLNQIRVTSESKDAEIHEQLNQMSKQLETLSKNCGKAFEQEEVVSDPLDAMSTTVRDDTGIMKEYYTSMKQDGWLQYNNYLYKLFKERVTFDAAVERCQDQDASLVEITDQEEFQFLSDNFKYYFWVGATDRQNEGEWRWLSGQLVEDGYWYDREPNDWGSGQDCMGMSGFWSKYFDFYCTDNYLYMCKRQ